MQVIYSEKKIEGLEGVYASPRLFDGNCEVCSEVYTDDEQIKQAYEAKEIKVTALTVKEPVKKRAKQSE